MKQADIALARDLSREGRGLFYERLRRKQVPRHQRVIDRGDTVSGAYFVLSGALRVFTLGSNGRETDLYLIEPGETCILALNALFNDVLYPAWVETESDSVIAVLPGQCYRALFASEPAIQDLTVRALSSAVFGLMSAIEDRTAQTVAQRLASYLLLRAKSDGKVRNTQQELASRVGTTREVVGRQMALFAEAGLLRSGRGVITLLDRPGLQGKHVATD